MSVVALIVPVEVPPEFEKTIVAPPLVTVLPAASLPVSVTTTPEPLATVLLATDTTELVAEIIPGKTDTVGKLVATGVPLTFALILVAVPAKTPVKLAVYVPLPTSVTALKVPVELPPLLLKVIVAPPEVIKFPAESFEVKVTCTALPLTTVALATVTLDCVAEIAPGVTDTTGARVAILEPLIVAPIVVAEPDKTPVKVAV